MSAKKDKERRRQQKESALPKPQQPGGPTRAEFASLAQTVQQVVGVVHRTETSWKGPVPNPADLKAYEAIEPGLAARLIKMTENALEHRQSIESRATEATIGALRAGRWMAFLLGFLLLGLAGYCAYLGEAATAITCVGTEVGAVMIAYITGVVKGR